jgi:hypothetical protein
VTVLTRRGAGLLLGAALLWVAARSFGVPELQLAAGAALVLLVLAVLGVLVASGRLTVDRVVRPGVLPFEGEATVVLTVGNASALPTAPLEVRDRVPAALGGSRTVRRRPLGPRGRTTVTRQLVGLQRGRVEVGPCEITVRDPFGLARRRRVLGGTSRVTVHPRVWELPPGVALGGATASGSDGRRRLTPGGEDLADIREYVRGDDLRSVHWPSTAHRGKLMVRQSESPEAPRAVLVLDLRRDRHLGAGADASVETAVSAAASVGFHLTSRGRSVVLADAPLAGPATSLPWSAWLERLADADTAEVDLPGLLHQVGQGMTGDGTLVVVATVPTSEELQLLVRAGRGFTTRLALLVDAGSHATGRLARTPELSAETAAAALQAAGWRVAPLRAGDRIDHAWRELVLQRRPGRSTVA